MRIALLGSLQVDEGRTSLSPRDRVILLALASRPGAELSTETLAETLWGDDLPDSWQKVVQGCVSRLRKALGPGAIETTAHGYRLALHRDEMDHALFEHLLARGRLLLADGEPERALFVTRQARELWRGEPFTELADWAPGRVESERLIELWRDTEDLHAEAALRAGQHRDVLADASRLVAEQPTRERRWGLLALAQYQDGRQGDALQTLHHAKQTLVGELGLDPGPELAELERAILRQDPALIPPVERTSTSAVCPYLGLIAYDVTDATTFFGRESDVSACLRRLDESRVVAVLGPSGCGKSSLLRAGVAAALERDGRAVHVITPGTHPADALAAAHLRATDVLVVDQCEEVLALEPDSPQRRAFLDALVSVAGSGQGLVALSMRADRLGELSGHPEFARLVESGLYLLGPMAAEDLRRAIEGPAAQAGLRLEPGLSDLLIREVSGEPAALPLLSHVLRQTWRHREGATLTVQGYAATGGVREAVAQSAEGLFRRLDPQGQAIVRELMLRLVSPGEGGDPVRTRVARRVVTGDAAHLEVVEQLVAARLLASDGDTVEIAHESLALAWPRLRTWLDEDVDGLRTMRHLAVAATSWDQLGRPDSELYRGGRESRAAEWRARTNPTLTADERDFLGASAALADREQRATEEQVRRERRLNRRLRLGLAATAALLAVAVLLGTVARTSADRADQQAATAARQARAADARRLGAEALRSDEIDRALLMAVAGARLDLSSDTVNTLTGVLDRVPQLVAAARSTSLVSLSVSPDGTRVAAGEAVRGVSIRDATTLREVARNDDIPVAGVQYSPDGSTLAVAVNPWTPVSVGRVDPVPLRLLDAVTGRRLAHQPGGTPQGRVLHHSFGFSPDGRWLAAGFISPIGFPADTVVQVWDTTAPARPTSSFTVPYIVGTLQVGKGARRLQTTSDNGDLHLLDPRVGRALRTIPTAEASSTLFGPIPVVRTPDGTHVAVRDGDQVRLLDAETLATTVTFREDGSIGLPLAISPDGRQLAYTVDGTAVVRSLTDPARPGVRYPSGDSTEPWALAFGTGGSSLLAARNDGLLLSWDTTGTRQFLPSTPPRSGTLAADYSSSRISPDGRTVAYLLSSSTDRAVVLQLLDVGTRTLGPAIPLDERFDYWVGLAWRSDSSAVAAMLGTEQVRVCDRRTGQLLEQHREAGDRITTAAFSQDGSRLVIGTKSGWVRSVAGDGRRTGPPVRASSTLPVTAVAVDDHGARAVATVGEEAQVIDLAAGTVSRRAALGYTLSAAGWTHDGTAVALSGQDFRLGGAGVVGLYDAATLARLGGSTGRATAGGGQLQLEPGGRRWLTTFADRVALWDSGTGALLRTLGTDDRSVAGFAADGSTLVLASPRARLSRWDPQPEAAIRAACSVVGRDMTVDEWRTDLPGRRQRPVCPG